MPLDVRIRVAAAKIRGRGCGVEGAKGVDTHMCRYRIISITICRERTSTSGKVRRADWQAGNPVEARRVGFLVLGRCFCSSFPPSHLNPCRQDGAYIIIQKACSSVILSSPRASVCLSQLASHLRHGTPDQTGSDPAE